jgi:serine/threonine protein kinase
MSHEFSSGVRLQVGHVIQDPVGNFEYVVETVLESGANAFAAKAARRRRASEGGENSGYVFLKKYKSPGGSSSWFDGFVDYQQEIRRCLQSHPQARQGMVEILKFFQKAMGSDTRRRAYYQLFLWEGQANNLRDFMKNRPLFLEEEAAAERYQIACDLLTGLSGIHSAGVIHSDLKPENLMLNPNPQGAFSLKYVDFDFSLVKGKEAPWINPPKPEDKMGYLGTERYLSPEHLKAQRPSEASDIFTAGIILAELLTGRHPVGNDKEMYNRRVLGGQFGKVRLPDSVRAVVDNPDDLDQAINRMLSFDSNNRPTAAKIADLFKENMKVSRKDEEELEEDTENGQLEKAGEEILAKLARSKPSPTTIESPASKPEIYEAREEEDKKDFRKIALFLAMLVGIPLLFWKFIPGKTVTNPQKMASVSNTQAPSPNQNLQENAQRSPKPNPATRSENQPQQIQRNNIFPKNKVALGAKKKVRFNLIGYRVESGVMTRLNLNINQKANGPDILRGQIWPEQGFDVTEFRLWSPLLERVLIWWNTEWIDPLGDSQGSDRKGFYGSTANGKIGPNPCIHDMEIFKPENCALDVYLWYKGQPITSCSENPPLVNPRFFGETIKLKYRSSDSDQIQVRFDNDTEDEGEKLTLATLARLKNDDSEGIYHFVELDPQPEDSPPD